MQKIKDQASAAITEGNFEEAFEALWEIGVDAFILFIQKKKWYFDRNHLEVATYFWTTFIINDLYFESIMNSSLKEVLLHDYYSKTNIFSKEFECKIAKEHADTFIKAVKTNQVFFNREDKIDRITFLTEEIQLPKELQIHQQVWKLFHDKELELWRFIEDTLEEIVRLPLTTLLYMTTYWVEENYISNTDRGIQQAIADAYSFFIEMYVKHPKVTLDANVNQELFEINFMKILFEEGIDENHIVFNCLGTIYNRNYFFNSYFDPYCFDENMSPSIIYHSLYFTTKPQAHYKWKIDGLRYYLLEQSYFRIGGFVIDDLIVKGGEVPSNQASNQDDNIELAKKRQGLIRVLDHLGMEVYFDRRNKTQIDVDHVISPLQAFAFNRLVRYERKIKHYYHSTDKWLDAFKKYFILEKENAYLPFVYLSKQEYKSLNRKGIKNYDDTNSDTLLKLFQYTSLSKEFNRFRTDYNIFMQPFLGLGNYVFSPIVFFTSFTGIYVYVDSLLKNNSREEDTIIEDRLAALLENSKWKVKQIKEKDLGKIDGDADLIVYNEHTIILMQLKRTNLRLNSKEAYYNHIDVDIKAAKQLNDAEHYFSIPNKYFEIGNRKIHKWIISTSLEDVQREINGCLKLSYFDFFIGYFRNSLEQLTFNSLESLIQYFEGDFLFEHLLEEYPQLETQRSIDEISKYHFPFHEFDSNKVKKYKDLFNHGLELNRNRENYESIATFQKCLEFESEDIEVHSAIANVYADIRDYRRAFYHFDKALSLLPNDPFIMANYCGALLEVHDTFTVIIIDHIFGKLYPFILDTRHLKMDKYQRGISNFAHDNK